MNDKAQAAANLLESARELWTINKTLAWLCLFEACLHEESK